MINERLMVPYKFVCPLPAGSSVLWKNQASPTGWQQGIVCPGHPGKNYPGCSQSVTWIDSNGTTDMGSINFYDPDVFLDLNHPEKEEHRVDGLASALQMLEEWQPGFATGVIKHADHEVWLYVRTGKPGKCLSWTSKDYDKKEFPNIRGPLAELAEIDPDDPLAFRLSIASLLQYEDLWRPPTCSPEPPNARPHQNHRVR